LPGLNRFLIICKKIPVTLILRWSINIADSYLFGIHMFMRNELTHKMAQGSDKDKLLPKEKNKIC
jgi:hypothetical protein